MSGGDINGKSLCEVYPRTEMLALSQQKHQHHIAMAQVKQDLNVPTMFPLFPFTLEGLEEAQLREEIKPHLLPHYRLLGQARR